MKEHHKISNIPKFRWEMLLNADNIALRNLKFSSHFRLQTGNGYHSSKILILTSLNKNFITA
jgi:hypothetical protein